MTTLFLFLTCACGQKGPLFLPKTQDPAPQHDSVNEQEKEEAQKNKQDGGQNAENP
ncbi:MAG: putative small lipoprotein YifL [Lysobacterales bacterium]|jgi:predicted small lipoprotein YifL